MDRDTIRTYIVYFKAAYSYVPSFLARTQLLELMRASNESITEGRSRLRADLNFLPAAEMSLGLITTTGRPLAERARLAGYNPMNDHFLMAPAWDYNERVFFSASIVATRIRRDVYSSDIY